MEQQQQGKEEQERRSKREDEQRNENPPTRANRNTRAIRVATTSVTFQARRQGCFFSMRSEKYSTEAVLVTGGSGCPCSEKARRNGAAASVLLLLEAVV